MAEESDSVEEVNTEELLMALVNALIKKGVIDNEKLFEEVMQIRKAAG